MGTTRLALEAAGELVVNDEENAVGAMKTKARKAAEQRLAPIEEIVEAIALGQMVVLVDDEDRENEGDLVMAASAATPDAINFMISQGRGLVCMPMTAKRAAELDLCSMVQCNEDDFGTAFTVSIDARADHGVTTGISAADRSITAALAATHGVASDFNRPGHLFPLVARDGGVLERIGHTEAAVDLARLAGLPPVGLIVEIVGDSGEMLRLPELIPWARERGILISTIERLRSYLQESTLEKVG